MNIHSKYPHHKILRKPEQLSELKRLIQSAYCEPIYPPTNPYLAIWRQLIPVSPLRKWWLPNLKNSLQRLMNECPSNATYGCLPKAFLRSAGSDSPSLGASNRDLKLSARDRYWLKEDDRGSLEKGRVCHKSWCLAWRAVSLISVKLAASRFR